jgi:predicted XRE-type DNA-binding protein
MRGKHIKIELSEEARNELEKFTRTGKHSDKLVTRAKLLHELDEAGGRKPLTQAKIAEKIGVDRRTVNDVKKAFLAADSAAVFLQRKKRRTPPVQPKITGEVEAHSIALACGPVPEGCAQWSVRLLADKSVELNYIDSISFKSVQRLLKKHNLNPTGIDKHEGERVGGWDTVVSREEYEQIFENRPA